MVDITQRLMDLGKEHEIIISRDKADKFQMYAEMLVDWNERVNLTAITNPHEIIEKHFIDSMLVMKASDISGKSIIDVGTGAGFPGMVLKIMDESIKLTLLDSLSKRTVFLREAADRLGIHAEIVHGRAELIARSMCYRDNYDIAVSRAVAKLRMLSEYCLPFLKTGGTFIAMKGPGAECELKAAKNAITLLSGSFEEAKSFVLSSGEERVILKIKKVAPTSDRFPRGSNAIAKKELK